MKMVTLNHVTIALTLCSFLFVQRSQGIIFNPIDHINKQSLQVIRNIVSLFSAKAHSKEISLELFLKNQSTPDNEEKQSSVTTFKDRACIKKKAPISSFKRIS